MESLTDFWQLVLDVWQHGVGGVDVGRFAAAIGLLTIFLVLRRLFTKFVMGWLRAMARRTSWTLDDHILDTIEPPVQFIPVVMGIFFATQVLELDGTFADVAQNLVRSLVAFTIFWGFYRALAPMAELLHRFDYIFTPELVDWLVKAIKVAIVAIGAAAILEIWGIQVGPIIAGFGLLGVAVALGAQDLFKNLIAGLLILGEKRFKRGDWIRVDGVVEGTVEAIGFRSTMIRRFDKAPVMVPNAKLSDSAVTNFSAMTHRRIYWIIGVEYSTTIEQLRQIRDEIEAYISDNPDFASRDEVSTFVRIDKFADSSIDIMLYCFTRTTNWGAWLEIKEKLAFHIKEVVETAGTGFAFPSQSIYVETVPGERPEPFVPPTANRTPTADVPNTS